MLESLQGKVSDRKLRLFACACCRRISSLLSTSLWRDAVEVGERYADRMATVQELRATYETDDTADLPEDLAACAAVYPTDALAAARTAASSAAEAVSGRAEAELYAAYPSVKLYSPCYSPEDVFEGTYAKALADGQPDSTARACASSAAEAAREAASSRSCEVDRAEKKQQCLLVRDIFNPFRPVTLDPAWLTPKVVALAQAIYDERSFGRLPELGDALAEAGCSDAEVLGHCRGAGPHVRGCWVVDCVLGKS